MSAARYDDIQRWFNWGVTARQSFLVVWCDGFSNDDYPVYYKSGSQALRAIDNPEPMQRVMEVYDLKRERDPQLRLYRCYALIPGGL